MKANTSTQRNTLNHMLPTIFIPTHPSIKLVNFIKWKIYLQYFNNGQEYFHCFIISPVIILHFLILFHFLFMFNFVLLNSLLEVTQRYINQELYIVSQFHEISILFENTLALPAKIKPVTSDVIMYTVLLHQRHQYSIILLERQRKCMKFIPSEAIFFAVFACLDNRLTSRPTLMLKPDKQVISFHMLGIQPF